MFIDKILVYRWLYMYKNWAYQYNVAKAFHRKSIDW